MTNEKEHIVSSRMCDITGKRFGRFVALKPFQKTIDRKHEWECLCDCGKRKNVLITSLTGGKTKSCGCLIREKTIERLMMNNPTVTTHGMSKTRIYTIWKLMILRTTKSHKDYSDRGIKTEKRWHSLENFVEDMKKSYDEHVAKFGEKNTTIDRIDNDRGYSRDNCRWATRSEQARNTRVTPRATINGVTKPIREWAEINGIKIDTVRYRLKCGWPIERAVTEPSRTLITSLKTP